ncbi:MAG: FkbM family methyltransferase [Microgenomates group bacterium]|nr:FkbM family methyltransferase [Microgenomates group bacterium]
MAFLIKIFYSIFALTKIAFYLENPFVLLKFLFKKDGLFCLKNKMRFKIFQLMDLIVIKDTIINDEYKINKLKNPKIIIDLGAGIGDFAIFCAKKFPQVKVFAFEPNKKVFLLLKENLSLNRLKNVRVKNLAIGLKKQYNFYLNRYHVQGSIIKKKDVTEKIKIRARKLSEYIRFPIDLVKIDCEGAEVEILKSLTPKSFKKIKRFAIEYHNNLLVNSDKKIIAILIKNGFRYKQIKDRINPGTGYIYGFTSPTLKAYTK